MSFLVEEGVDVAGGVVFARNAYDCMSEQFVIASKNQGEQELLPQKTCCVNGILPLTM